MPKGHLGVAASGTHQLGRIMLLFDNWTSSNPPAAAGAPAAATSDAALTLAPSGTTMLPEEAPFEKSSTTVLSLKFSEQTFCMTWLAKPAAQSNSKVGSTYTS